MKLDKKIYKLNKKIIEINRRLSSCEKFGKTRFFYLKYKKMQVELDCEINRLLVPILETESTDFRKIANDNYKILISDNFEFKTIKKDVSYIGSFAAKLIGKLHDNGYIYCETKATNFPFLFYQYAYPERFEGKVDCLGNVVLNAVETNSSLFKTLPSKFESNIGTDGFIEVFTTDREIDITGGKQMINKVVGNLFHNKKDLIDTFIQNKNKLLFELNEFRIKNQLVKTLNNS